MSDGRNISPPPHGRQIAPPAEVPQYSYGWLMPIVGALVALVLAVAIYKLHYSYGQAPHRIVKMLN